jgi:hypothetical protein
MTRAGWSFVVSHFQNTKGWGRGVLEEQRAQIKFILAFCSK